jgi:hypothetical protein
MRERKDRILLISAAGVFLIRRINNVNRTK